MGDFRTVFAEGDFYLDGDSLKVKFRGDITDVTQVLESLLGEEIQLAIHYVPPMPPDMTKWGGGCCNLQATGYCPAGHHEDPFKLLNVHGQGVLRHGSDAWYLEKFDGTKQIFPVHFLAGHHARLVAATVFDVEKMRDSLPSAVAEQVDSLGTKAKSLQDILNQLSAQVKEFN